MEAGRKLVPTNLGIVLVHGYQKVRREFCQRMGICNYTGL